MNLWKAGQQFFPSQAEAKKAKVGAPEAVEVPTDKKGLIEFLNSFRKPATK